MDERQVVIFVYVGCGLLLAGLSIPLILKGVPPNPFYGFRVPRTMNNPEIWYAINAYAGWWLLAAGLGTALSAAILLVMFPGWDKDITAMVQGLVAVVLLGVAIIASFNRLKTM